MITRKPATASLIVLLGTTFLATAPAVAQLEGHSHHAVPVQELIRYEATGVSLLNPYERGRVPVLFIHGLWLHPGSWHRMIATLEKDPALSSRYQFWTFGYSTGDPIPYSAHLLRDNLTELRTKLDPERSDPALDRMVIVGHSMGGLLTRLMATSAGDHLWQVVSERPFGELTGEKADIDLFRSGLFFARRPEVRRVVYIATPHRGSRFDRGPIERIGTRLVRLPDPLAAAHHRLVSRNAPTFFREHFRKTLPTSIDELQWGSPILTGLGKLVPDANVKVHSIVAIRPGTPAGEERSDGLVSYDSAHVAEAMSEKIVMTGHLCQDHPEVIDEVRRILVEHAGP